MIPFSFISLASNPNEQTPDHEHNRDRGKYKNVEWAHYENVHKKYLNLGKNNNH